LHYRQHGDKLNACLAGYCSFNCHLLPLSQVRNFFDIKTTLSLSPNRWRAFKQNVNNKKKWKELQFKLLSNRTLTKFGNSGQNRNTLQIGILRLMSGVAQTLKMT
jgi:hypothetical protein